MSNILQLTTRRHGRTLASPTLFGVLAPALQSELRAAAFLRRFAAGQTIQQRGDEPNGFWLIESGAVAVGQFLPEGEFRAVAHLEAGDSYGELAVLSGRNRVVDAVARTEAQLRWIDAARFEALLLRQPGAMRTLMGALAEELQEMIDLVAGAAGSTGVSRVAHFLFNLSGTGSVIAIGQQELGELAGVTRATANAALRTLEEAGCLTRGYRRVTVIDRARLAGWAGR